MSPMSLPDVIPVFPLTGAVLLPSCTLPLNIFEPRYLQMVRDAAASHNIIGMIQPEDPSDVSKAPALYSVGGAGRIGRISETDDGRLLINLEGLCRFKVAAELSVTTPYRQVNADWAPYLSDLLDNPVHETVDRASLMRSLEAFLDRRALDADMDAVSEAPDEALVNSLSMILPLGSAEKQALVEAPDLETRAQTLVALMDMDDDGDSDALPN